MFFLVLVTFFFKCFFPFFFQLSSIKEPATLVHSITQIEHSAMAEKASAPRKGAGGKDGKDGKDAKFTHPEDVSATSFGKEAMKTAENMADDLFSRYDMKVAFGDGMTFIGLLVCGLQAAEFCVSVCF